MKLAKFKVAVAALAVTLSAVGAQAQDWEPSGPIKMMIAFRAGGGADTMGRLLAEELSTRRGWEIIPENVTGKGGGTMAVALKGEPADGLAIGVTVSESTTYNVQAARNPGYALDDFDYISTISGSQMGVIAKADRGWSTLGDVIEAAKAGEKISFGAMSQKLADAAYVIGKNNGVEFTTVMVQGGKGGLNGVVADDIDIAWAAGVQTPGVQAGDLVNLVSAEDAPLNISPDAPLLDQYNVPFTFGVKFIVVAPAGLSDNAKATYTAAIADVLNDPESKLSQFVTRAFSGPELIQADDLTAYMHAGFDNAGALLDASSE
ncbi:MAG: tripartite tricarboxylate transporter substrate-binding protein [Pseudomonadota bacterium]